MREAGTAADNKRSDGSTYKSKPQRERLRDLASSSLPPPWIRIVSTQLATFVSTWNTEVLSSILEEKGEDGGS